MSSPDAWADLQDETAAGMPSDNAITYSFAAADIDGDNDTDILAAENGQARLLTNNGTGVFTDVSSSQLPAMATATLRISVADIDNDHDADALLTDVQGVVRLLLNNGSGIFTDESGVRLPVLDHRSSAVQVGDVNKDGALDLLIGNYGNANQLLLNNGSGYFSPAAGALPADADPTLAIILHDLTADGSPDIVFLNRGNDSRLLVNNGLGVFSDETGARFPFPFNEGLDGQAADLDGDGDTDLVVAAGNDSVRIMLNDGSGHFTDQSAALLPPQNDYTIKVKIGDIDYDGNLDIIAANAGEDKIYLYNPGSGTFGHSPAGFLPADDQRSFGLALADLDNDFDLDIILGRPGDQDNLLINEVPFPRIRTTISPAYIEVGDPVTISAEAFDEDGVATLTLVIIKPDASEETVPLAGGSATYFPDMAGTYAARVDSSDTLGNIGSIVSNFEVLAADLTAPVVSVVITGPSPTLLGHTIDIQLTATDDRAVTATQLTVNGVTISTDSSGRASYTTDAAGTLTVIGTAWDAAGNEGSDTVTWDVEGDTLEPAITLTVAPDPVDLVNPVSIHATATDNVLVSSLTATITEPGGATQAVPLDETGDGSYTPYLPGTYTVEADAADPAGNVATSFVTFEAVGIPDTEAPTVNLTVTPHTVAIGGSISITVTATDDTLVSDLTADINGTPLTLDADGGATYTPPLIGPYTLTVTATDPTGNETTAVDTFKAVDPTGDLSPPTVIITSPAEDQDITTITQIIGTVADETLATWTLSFAPVDTTDFQVIVSDDRGVNNDVLGTFDPTQLENGFYTILLEAEDLNGASASDQVVIKVTGNLKLGQFTISFKDKALNIGSFPLDVNRGYDSRRRAVKGDFGYGWDLGLSEAVLLENRSPGENWSSGAGGGFIPTYYLYATKPHTVTIRLGSDKEVLFSAKPDPEQQQLFPIEFLNGMVYEPVKEGTGTLAPNTSADIYLSGVIYDYNFEIYNPSEFTYTSADHYIYRFTEVSPHSLRHKLTSITDPNGTTVTLNSDGFIRSDGLSLAFTRDSEGRITKITDPMGYEVTYQYDANGDLSVFTDAEGNQTTFIYDSDHYLTEVQDPLGRPLQKQEYDENGRLIAITDAGGQRIEFEYDITGRTQIMRDRRGNPTIYEYDAKGNILSETNFPTIDGVVQPAVETREFNDDNQVTSNTDQNGTITNNTYTAAGKLASTVRDAGPGGLHVTETFTYDAAGHVLTRTDPRGNVTSSTYDADGNILTSTEADGGVTLFEYNSNGQVTRKTDALGNVTLYEYDGRGNKTAEEVYAAGATEPLQRREFTYDANGNVLTDTILVTVDGTVEQATRTFTYNRNAQVLTETDQVGNTTTHEYNALGQKIADIDAAGNRTEYAYDLNGNLIRIDYPDATFVEYTYDPDANRTSETDRNGNTTTFTYDALNRIIRVDFADGTYRIKLYDGPGNLIGEIDEGGNRTDHEYDALGRRILTRQPEVYDPLSAGNLRPETVYEYDAGDNQVAVVDANGRRTEYVFDAMNRKTVTTYPDGNTAVSTYDPLGREIARTDPQGLISRYEYDALGRLLKVSLPRPAAADPRPETVYAYDEAGNLISQTDANGHETTFAYDLAGHRTARTLPGGERETFTYNALGKVNVHTDFNGDSTTFGYDSAGRRTSVTYADGSTILTSYYGEGQRLAVNDSRGTTGFTLDSRNRLLSVSNPDGTTISYTYHPTGKLQSTTGPAGSTTYTYDAIQRLATVVDVDGRVTSYGYDPVGNQVLLSKPNGSRTEFAYNDRNQLTRRAEIRSDGSVYESFDYTLNPDGLRTSVTEADGSQVQYGYDDNYRLISEVRTGTDGYTKTYAYDPAGNRLTDNNNGLITAYTYDPNDRLVTAGALAYSYDANGNLVAVNDAGAVTSYAYDHANHLMRATMPDGTVTSYAYDADGNRIGRADASSVISYLPDSNNPTGLTQVLEERDGGGALLAFYTYGAERISMHRAAGPSFYIYDGLGSTRGLSDLAETATDSYIYDGFGRQVSSSGSTANDYRFAGESFDPNIGMYYLRARYYDQGTGRFISMDPAQGDPMSPMSLHRYLYANNNPVNFTDPTGEQTSLIEINVTLAIQSTIRSIYTKRLIKLFLSAVKTAYCSLEPAYQMQARGLDMIARNLPGGFELVDQARSQIAKGYAAIGRDIVDTYKNIANDIIKVDVKVSGLLYDLYQAYTSGHMYVPVPAEVAKILEYRDKLNEWMGKFAGYCRDANALLNGSNCDKFTALAKNADLLLDHMPDF